MSDSVHPGTIMKIILLSKSTLSGWVSTWSLTRLTDDFTHQHQISPWIYGSRHPLVKRSYLELCLSELSHPGGVGKRTYSPTTFMLSFLSNSAVKTEETHHLSDCSVVDRGHNIGYLLHMSNTANKGVLVSLQL